MSELAFNINGEAFEVPATATGWRVRRMKHKGAPEVVYGRDGLPLVLSIEAELDDLKGNVDTTGRYRLDPVDDNFKPILNAPSAYVYVNTTGTAVAAVSSPSAHHSDSVVIEAMRMNAEIARSVIDRFPQMVEAAATLIRAADGAGIPARSPRIDAGEEGEGDGDEQARPSGFDLNALVAQFVPMLVMGLANGKMKVPGLGEMLDWRKATPAVKQRPKSPKAATAAEVSESEADVPENANDVLPPIDPQTMAHFVAVQSALTPEESAIAREVAKELSATELRAWFDELGALSVPEAVDKVRKLISGFGKSGGAS